MEEYPNSLNTPAPQRSAGRPHSMSEKVLKQLQERDATAGRYQRMEDGSLLDTETGEVIVIRSAQDNSNIRKKTIGDISFRHTSVGVEAYVDSLDSLTPPEALTASVANTARAKIAQAKNAVPVKELDSKKLPRVPQPAAGQRRKGNSWREIIQMVGDELVTIDGDPTPLRVAVVRAAFYYAMSGNASMLKELFERSEGKMAQALQVSAGPPVEAMSDEQVDAAILALIQGRTKDATEQDEYGTVDNTAESGTGSTEAGPAGGV